MKTIGIVGSRRRDTAADLRKVIAAFEKVYDSGDAIVSGGCKEGGDRFAEYIANTRGVTITIHYPRKENLDQRLLLANPRAAYARINYARNALVAGQADVLIACPRTDAFHKGGTENTMRAFQRLHPKGKLIRV